MTEVKEKNNVINKEDNQKVQLDKKTLVKAWALTYSSETCYNYERLQALGNTNQMITVVRKLYKTKEKQVKALKKYMVFFNTEPSWIGPIIHGTTIAMEEQAANGENITDEDINSFRTGMMGPMAGIGDTVSQAVAYPILAGIACSLAIEGNVLGPIFFEVAFKILMILTGYNCFMLGYKGGKNAIMELLKNGTINKVTEAFGIIGLMVVGNMSYSRVNVMTPIAFKIGQVDFVLQDVFNMLLPGIIPLAITLFVWWLLKSKKMSATKVIFIIFILGIILSYTGILTQITA